MNNKNHCVCACVRQAKNVACVGRKGEQSQWLLMNVFSFFFFLFPPEKKQTNKTRKTTVENLCASRLAAVELVTATRFYPHSLTREREFRLGLWQTGQEGGVKRIGGGTQPPTRGRSTHTQKPASFSAIATRKNCVLSLESVPCVRVCSRTNRDREKPLQFRNGGDSLLFLSPRK